MDKTRVSTSDKADKPSNTEVICPLVLKVTNGHSAVNYDLTWAPTVKLGDSEPGAWRSAPQKRGHSDAFYAKLKELREQGKIGWEDESFYFTHEQGIAARKKYEQLVLDGKVKANRKSWTNRFEGFTGVSFDQLMEKYPELYKSTTTSSSMKQESPQEPQQMEAAGLDLEEIEGEAETDDTEPAVEDLSEIEASEEESVVAAVTATEKPIADLEDLRPDEDDDVEELNVTTLRLTGYDEAARLSEDTFIRNVNGQDVQFYEVELPDIEATMFLPAGEHMIEGTMYRLLTEEPVEGSIEEDKNE